MSAEEPAVRTNLGAPTEVPEGEELRTKPEHEG